MKDKRSLHLKMQELCDCFATADPLREMSLIPKEEDKEEAGLKWLALAALHGVNNNAKKITLSKEDDGSIKVVAKYRKAELPSPDAETGKRILDEIREITHIEGGKGKMPLALGIRDSSLELVVKVEGDEVVLKFPETK